MCRIAGFLDLNYSGDYDLKETTVKMGNALMHGGPDGAGVFTEDKIALGLSHRRLSILDLSPSGSQPMRFDNLVIVYNGEVYNFKNVRQELIERGYSFKSNTDTEVVLKAFHRWGFNCVHKFRGMWAFAVWDRKNHRLILCRDRVGVKPLYWHYRDGLFIFASELKAIHEHPKFQKKLNKKVLPFYFKYGYIPTPYSIFQSTYKLKPGHFLIVSRDGRITIRKYWAVEDYFFDENRKREMEKRKETEVVEELESILTESFKLRLVSDVPVGVFLSGGIDSSLVTALLQKEIPTTLKTFTIGFYEKEYNEAPYAKKVAQYLGTDHYEFYITPKEAHEAILRLPEIYDEPFGDSSAVPTYLLSKYARQLVKVALSADGGDEQFCGYTNYWATVKLSKINSKIPYIVRKFLSNVGKSRPIYSFAEFIAPHLNLTNFRGKYPKLLNALNCCKPLEVFDISKSIYLDEELTKLLKFSFKPGSLYKEYKKVDTFQSMMMQDIKTYMMDDILVKVDRATMSVALEGREPLLDNKILEFSACLPVRYKYNRGVTKYIIRKILYKYVPKNLIERPKQGFGVPIYEWFKNELRELYECYLSKEKIRETGIFNEEFVRRKLKEYYEGKMIPASHLWTLLQFQMWAEKWL